MLPSTVGNGQKRTKITKEISLPIRVSEPGQLNVGDFFESCSFHPCRVLNVDSTGCQLEGVSLVDGGAHRCNIRHCGLRLLSAKEASRWKELGPEDVVLPLEDQWWQKKNV